MMKKMKKRTAAVLLVLLALSCALALPAAAGTVDPAGAVSGTWQAALAQIRKVVDGVVFPVIDVILGVWFFVKAAMTYLDYRKRGSLDLTAPIILFVSLVISLTAPSYLWLLLGA